MPSPTECKFTESHEWFKVDGDTVRIGITQFAADELTDVTYVDLPEVGTQVDAGSAICEVESVKTTSDVYSAVTGEVVEVNDAVTTDPSLLNSDPFGQGWLMVIRTDDTSALDGLMDNQTYDSRYACS